MKIPRNSFHAKLYLWHEDIFKTSYPYQDIFHYLAVIFLGAPFQYFFWQPITTKEDRYLLFFPSLFVVLFFISQKETPWLLLAFMSFLTLIAWINLGYAHKILAPLLWNKRRQLIVPSIEIQ
jgi:hypothetical protein